MPWGPLECQGQVGGLGLAGVVTFPDGDQTNPIKGKTVERHRVHKAERSYRLAGSSILGKLPYLSGTLFPLRDLIKWSLVSV